MASPSPVFTTFLTRSGRKSQETLSKTWSVNMAKFICEVITKGCRLLREKTQETPAVSHAHSLRSFESAEFAEEKPQR